jgi:hypothetical protein
MGIDPEGTAAGETTEDKGVEGGKSSFGSETYDPLKEFSVVQMIQGEVLQDEDWNAEGGDVGPITREEMMKKLDSAFSAIDEDRLRALEDMKDIQAVKTELTEEEAERLKDKFGSDDPRTPPPEEVSNELLDSSEIQIPLNVPVETPEEDIMVDPRSISPTDGTDSADAPSGGGKTQGGDKDGSKGGISGTTSPDIPTSDPQGETTGQTKDEGKGGATDETTSGSPKDGFDTGEPSGGGETKGGGQGGSGPISGTTSPGIPTSDPEGGAAGGAQEEEKGSATGATAGGTPKDGFDTGDGGSDGGAVESVSGGAGGIPSGGGLRIEPEIGTVGKIDEGDDNLMVDPRQVRPTEDDDDDEE